MPSTFAPTDRLVSIALISALPLIMDISKATSVPPDPRLPSFLTLPAEICNSIYELLFTRENTVLLHNARDYSADTRPLANGEADLKRFDHGLCRQVYHEAVGVLYGQNSFTVSRLRTVHDFPEYSENDTYNQTHFVPIWLQSLGSQ